MISSLLPGPYASAVSKKIHAEFDGATKEFFTRCPVGEGAEISGLSAESHGTVADAMHGEIAADGKGQ